MEQRGKKELVKRTHNKLAEKKMEKYWATLSIRQNKLKDMNNEDHYIMKSFTRNTQQFSIFMYSRI